MQMMKRTILLLSALGVAFLFYSFKNDPKSVAPKASIRTLVIDPGHGGTFPGARGSFSWEKDVSLAVALKFGKALEAAFPDLKIVYTRSSDANAGNKLNLKDELGYRANLANESGGDLFISIHCNSAGPLKQVAGYTTKTVYRGKGSKRKKVTQRVPKYRYVPNPASGTETYIWAVSKNDAKVSSINKNEESLHTDEYGEVDSLSTIELPDPSDPVEFARMLVYAQHYFRKSLDLADLVEKEFAASGRISRGVKQRNDKGIWVLQATGMPSILVELGFLTNKEEEEYLNSEKGQAEIVEDLVNAFRQYKEKTESKAMVITSP
jgi:N-acetylmuramoyl-L-alanine amidase